jgi:hypothetical protein
MDGKCHIQEGASLHPEFNGEEYEVWVTYNYITESGKEYVIIDFDYSYDDFIESLPFGI